MGLTELERATMWTGTGNGGGVQVSVTPRGEKPSRVVTVPKDREASARTNNVKSYDEYLSVLAASVAGRATEEVVFGRMGVTLATAQELSNATNTASILVMQSGTHPQFEYTVMEDQDLIRHVPWSKAIS